MDAIALAVELSSSAMVNPRTFETIHLTEPAGSGISPDTECSS